MIDLMLKYCSNCAHHRLDDEEWDWCERPGIPVGWNLLCEVQRYSKSEQCCGGRYWEKKT